MLLLIDDLNFRVRSFLSFEKTVRLDIFKEEYRPIYRKADRK